MMRLSRWLSHSLAALLCALCLAAVPAAASWAAGQPLTQADLKPLAEDDFDAKVKTLNALAAAPAEQAGPILQALLPDPAHPDTPRVLLIDEIDRADEPFEAFLLELLSDFQVSIPEFGTVRAQVIPLVIMTSNRTREVHDALKRRCLYQWIGYPDKARELQIVAQRAPEAAAHLQQRAVDFVHRLRGIDLFKAPGIAEAIDWCRALAALNVMELDPQSVQDTLGVLLKYQDDLARVDAPTIEQLLAAPALPE